MGKVQLNRRLPILSHSTWTVNYSCNLQLCKPEIHFPDHRSVLQSLLSPRVTLAVLRGLNKNGDGSRMAVGRSSAVCWSHCALSNRDSAALSSRNPNSQYLFSYLSELNQSPLRSMEFSHWWPWVLHSAPSDESARDRQEIIHRKSVSIIPFYDRCFGNDYVLYKEIWPSEFMQANTEWAQSSFILFRLCKES